MPCPGLVRAEGLEPPRLSSREPKSRASTSSATPARAPRASGRCRSSRYRHVRRCASRHEPVCAWEPGGAAYITRKPTPRTGNLDEFQPLRPAAAWPRRALSSVSDRRDIARFPTGRAPARARDHPIGRKTRCAVVVLALQLRIRRPRRHRHAGLGAGVADQADPGGRAAHRRQRQRRDGTDRRRSAFRSNSASRSSSKIAPAPAIPSA